MGVERLPPKPGMGPASAAMGPVSAEMARSLHPLGRTHNDEDGGR